MGKLKELLLIILALINGVEYTPAEEKIFTPSSSYTVDRTDLPSDRELYQSTFSKVVDTPSGIKKSKDSRLTPPQTINTKMGLIVKTNEDRLGIWFRPFVSTHGGVKKEEQQEYYQQFLSYQQFASLKGESSIKDLWDAGMKNCYFTVEMPAMPNSSEYTQTAFFWYVPGDVHKPDWNSWREYVVNPFAIATAEQPLGYTDDVYTSPNNLGLGFNFTLTSPEPAANKYQARITFLSLSRLYPDITEDFRDEAPGYAEEDSESKLRPYWLHGQKFTESDTFHLGDIIGIAGTTSYRKLKSGNSWSKSLIKINDTPMDDDFFKEGKLIGVMFSYRNHGDTAWTPINRIVDEVTTESIKMNEDFKKVFGSITPDVVKIALGIN